MIVPDTFSEHLIEAMTMALPPWTVELLRRGLTDVAKRAGDAETLDKLKQQATDILHDLPQTAARGIDAVMRGAEASKKSVQRWSRKHTTLAVPMLNASGTLCHDFGCGVPLADTALEAGQEMLRGDCVLGPAAIEKLSKRLRRCFPGGDERGIAIANNFPAALTAFSMLVEQRPLIVHRSQAVRLPGGLPLPDAFGTLLPVIQEVGGVERAELSDFDSFDSFCVISADGGSRPVELLDFGQRDALQAVVLPVATLFQTRDDTIPSAENMLGRGADLVVMSGGGIAGGPDCGLIIGRPEAIDCITASAAWPSLRASEAIQTMMCLAAEAMAGHRDAVPIGALMETAEDNLRARAERMATRLSGSDRVATCHVAAEDARITADGRWRLPSRQVCVKHRTTPAAQWRQTLREELPAVLAGIQDEFVTLDLRWIAAADDARLATLIGGDVDSE